MKKTFRKKLATIIASVALAIVPLSVSVVAHASPQSTLQNGVSCGTQFEFNPSTTTSCGATSDTSNNIQNLLTDAINIFSVVVGLVAVVMIIVGGLKYITSGGESSKVSGAQSTILYAIVGLVIVVLAQVIVHFVLNRATTASSGV